jgi:Zn-dependent protease
MLATKIFQRHSFNCGKTYSYLVLKPLLTKLQVQNAPMNAFISFFVLVFSVVLHEIGHGYAALRLGDRTAQRLGRLTLNPISHIDPFLTIILPAVLFFSGAPMLGGAKPVPVNPSNFFGVSPRRGMLIVAAAGPAVNFLLVAIALAGLHLIPNHNLNLFNTFLLYVVLINAILGMFNCLPIPPLDGSKILAGLLPREQAYQFMRIERFGFFILLFVIFTGIHHPILNMGFVWIANLLPQDLIVLLNQNRGVLF